MNDAPGQRALLTAALAERSIFFCVAFSLPAWLYQNVATLLASTMAAPNLINNFVIS